MLGIFSEFERAIINERTRNRRIARLKENKWVEGKLTFGYTVNKDGKFEFAEKEVKIVRYIFKLRSKGFSKQRVDHILRNKNYIGVFEYKGKKEKHNIEFEIEPSISKYMWNKVNKLTKKG